MSGPKLDKELWGGAAAFDALLADIRARRSEFADQHFVSADIIDRFREIGIYRAFVPRAFGGGERSPTEFLVAIEAISEADGSAGWVASFGVCEAYLGGLPLESVHETWSDPDAVFAGAMFPLQKAEVVDGKYLLNGRWRWASGCTSADRIGVGIVPNEEGALPRMAVMPASQVQIDTGSWDMHGMAGTGSFDIVVEDVLVDPEWTFVRGAPLTPDGPFFRYPTITIAAQVLAVTSIGVAREAMNIVRSAGKPDGALSATGAPNIGDREYIQIEMAKAEARLRSARLFFYDSIDTAWDKLVKGQELDIETRNMMRLSCTHVTRECAAVVDAAYSVSGMAAAENSNHLSRCFRDVHLPTQHAFMGEMTLKNAGAVFFGREPERGYI
ncbi:MAG: acyl-CoA dehydrogenase family protein [Actinomycetota bacterium]|nr:acyl-CoA dehydrogenase family protein [Actinomycetota bacterium]